MGHDRTRTARAVLGILAGTRGLRDAEFFSRKWAGAMRTFRIGRLALVAAATAVMILSAAGAAQAAPSRNLAGNRSRTPAEVRVAPDTTDPGGPGCTTYRKKTVLNQDGRKETFWVGRSDGTTTSPGEVWHDYELSRGGPWNGPLSLGGEAYSGLDVASNADGRLEVFVKARGGDLNHIWQMRPNSSWSGWYTLGGAIFPGCGPIVHMLSFSRIAVDVMGLDVRIHRIYQQSPNGNWSGWVWP